MEKVILDYLQHLNISVSNTYFRKSVASHPEYPSILSLSDTLERLEIKHAVAKVQEEDLENIPFPFVLHLRRGQGQLLLIRSQQDLREHESDIEDWDGVILLIEESDVAIDEEHQEYISREKTVKPGLMILGVSALLFFILMLSQNFSWHYLLLLTTALAGTILGVLLTAKDVGIRYEAVEAFCNSGKKTNCERVLTSDEASLFGRFKLSDAVLSYFIFQLIITGLWLPVRNEVSAILSVLFVFTMFSLPVVGYSLYVQGVKLKSWCRLCLLVGGIFLVQAVLFGWMYTMNMFVFGETGIWAITQIMFLLVAIGSLEFLLKSRLEEGSESAEAEIAAKRVKYSPDVFSHLLEKEKRVNTSLFEKEILIGKPDTPIQIMMAASLSCSPCKEGFEKLSELIKAFPDQIYAVVRFRVNKTNEGQNIGAAETILSYWLANIHGKNDAASKTQRLIMDWYKRVDLQKFLEKYPVKHNGIDRELNDLAEQLTGWFKEENIQGTPTYFINGYQLPRHYRIDDLKILIPEFEDYFTMKNESKSPKRMFDAAE